MNELATSIDATSISACPAKIKQPAKTAKALAEVLGVRSSKLEKKLSSDKMFTWVARSVSPLQADRIRQLNLKYVYFESDYKRFYPQRGLAAQVLGFTNAEDKGLEGLEFKYNTLLEGGSLTATFTRDGKGRFFDLNKAERSDLKGKSIVLTLDKKIQHLTEKALEDAVKKHRARSGMALVMDPRTGEVLAMANYPGV